MRLFKVPFQTDQDLRILGGFISGYQAVSLGVGLVTAPLLLLLAFLPLPIRIILIIAEVIVSVVFATVKVGDLNFARYVYYYFKFKRRKKRYWLNSND